MKRTTSSTLTKCDECGRYEIVCDMCKYIFEDDDILYCDDELYSAKQSRNHYCNTCYKIINSSHTEKP